MFNRLKAALVNSFVGAIALGYLFAQSVIHFAYAFSAPIAGWLTRREYHGIMDRAVISPTFSLQDALPELVRSFSLLVVVYVLLRWLYFVPIESHTPKPASEQAKKLA